MLIRKFTWKEKERWDKFCLENDLAWFWHTSFRLRHALNCSLSWRSENHSFYLEDGNEIIAIIPLTVDFCNSEGKSESSKIIEMNYGGMTVPCPVVKQGFKKERKEKLLKAIFQEIDKIAYDNNVQRLAMRIPLTLSYCRKYNYYNFLMKYGFQDISLNTSIVSLTQSEEEIWDDMTENHKRATLKGKKFLQVRLYDKDSITEENFGSFRYFYKKIAGKKNIIEERFSLLFHYLKHGMAVLAEAKYKSDVVGYVAAILYKHDAYYLMGANESNFMQCPIAHLMHWEIIKYLKSRNISHYEIGIQQFSHSIYDQPSPKDVSISRFKRGFGGLTLPYFIGEKFYSKEYCRKLWSNRLENYLNYIK